jgi:signal transduction histidine kinase
MEAGTDVQLQGDRGDSPRCFVGVPEAASTQPSVAGAARAEAGERREGDAMEALYRRLGPRYMWTFRAACLVFSAFLCVLAAALFSFYQDMSLAQYARVVAVATVCNTVALAWGIWASLKPLAPVEAWLAGARGPDAARAAWQSALEAPPKLFLLQLWRSVLVTAIPVTAYIAVEFDHPLSVSGVILVAILMTASFPTLIGTIGVELYLRPLVREAAQAMDEVPEMPRSRIPLRWRVLAVFPLISIVSAMFVSVLSAGPGGATFEDLGIDVLVTLAVAGSSTLLIAHLVTQALLGPIEELVAAMGRVRQGDLAVRATVSSSDELGSLAESFNQMADDLQLSRQHLVMAREEERRRLRRDLHDGLGPSLTAISLHLDAAKRLIPARPEEAARVVDELSRQTRALTGEVRELVYGLRPPALDAVGLAGAIERAANALRVEDGSEATPEIKMHVDGDTGALPAAVEVAAYHIAREAIANAVRHADASRCRIDLDIRGHRVVVEVRDDGRGLPFDVAPGVGLHSMRERATELGGSCEVTASPGGGTLVRAELPV